jgi:hypothetical protein
MTMKLKRIKWRWLEPDPALRILAVRESNKGTFGCITEPDAETCLRMTVRVLRENLGLDLLQDFGVIFQPLHKTLDRIAKKLMAMYGNNEALAAPGKLRHFDLDERYALSSLVQYSNEHVKIARRLPDDRRTLSIALGNFCFGFPNRGGNAFFNYCAQFCSVIASTTSLRMSKEAERLAVDRGLMLLAQESLRRPTLKDSNQQQAFQIWVRIPLLRMLLNRNRNLPRVWPLDGPDVRELSEDDDDDDEMMALDDE